MVCIRCLLVLSLLFVLHLIPVLPLSAQLRLLVSTRTTGFRHGSIPAAKAMLERMALERGWSIRFTEADDVYDDASLRDVDVIVFANTTGDVVASRQHESFERFIRNGGGFVGIHAATDTEYDWPFYQELVGTYFRTHPAVQRATVHVLDTTHPSTKHLPASWSRTDEWYDFRTNPRKDVHVLAVLDERSYVGGTMGKDHPIAWCTPVGTGRSFYTAGGHTSESYTESEFVQHVLGGIVWSSGEGYSTGLEFQSSSFTLTPVLEGIEQSLTVKEVSDGQLLILARSGQIYAYDINKGELKNAGSISVGKLGESGALGMAIDKRKSVPRIFVTAADSKTSVFSVLSFRLRDNILDSSSIDTVLSFPYDASALYHIGGGLTFNQRTGELFVGTGDNSDITSAGGYPPMDFRRGRKLFDAQRTSANTNDLRGKILRVIPRDSGYAIPLGNLFGSSDNKARAEIYCMGLRNPFRIHVDSVSNVLFVGDVGPDGADSPLYGPSGRDELNFVSSAGNYGWPYFIGDNLGYTVVDSTPPARILGKMNPDTPVNSSPNNTGLSVLPAARSATYSYRYGEDDTSLVGSNNGRCIMAGPRIHFGPLRSQYSLPDALNGYWLYLDFVRGWIRALRYDVTGAIQAAFPVLLPADSSAILDVEFTSRGELFALLWDKPRSGATKATLARLDWTGRTLAPPRARINYDRNYGEIPLTVRLDASSSSGSGLSYAWDFDDDGSIDDGAPQTRRTYTKKGIHTIKLTVSDSLGRSSSAVLTIAAGNNPPTILNVEPEQGTIVPEGSLFTVRVTTSDNDVMDSVNVVSSVFIAHDDHTHPFDDAEGSPVTLRMPLLSNHGDARSLKAQVIVRAVDTGNNGSSRLESDTTITLNPDLVQAEHADACVSMRRESTDDGRTVLRSTSTNPSFELHPINLKGVNSCHIFYTATASCSLSITYSGGYLASDQEMLLATMDVPATGDSVGTITFYSGLVTTSGTRLRLTFDVPPNETVDVDKLRFVLKDATIGRAGQPARSTITVFGMPILGNHLLYVIHDPTFGPVRVVLHDQLGRVVAEDSQPRPAGQLSQLSVGSLPSGSYLLIAASNDGFVSVPVAISR